jgi:hypothetical protein
MSRNLRLAQAKGAKRCQASWEAIERWWNMTSTSFLPRRHALSSAMERLICGLRLLYVLGQDA